MGKKKASNKAVDPPCDHEAQEVSRGGNGSTFWACTCGQKQWVSGPDTGGKLLELTGKARLNVNGPQDPGRTGTIKIIDDPIPSTKKGKNVVQHSSATNEHYSPPKIVEPARRLMGGIDLDPASCAKANETVKAASFLTQEQDGLRYAWEHTRKDAIGSEWVHASRVFLNPPGGLVRIGKTPFSRAAIWWAKQVQEWYSRRVDQAVFVGFTLEILRSSQIGQDVPVQAFHRCYPRERIDFLDEQGQEQGAPGHGNVIVFLPPVNLCRTTEVQGGGMSNEEHWDRTFADFKREFGSLGYCERGVPYDRT